VTKFSSEKLVLVHRPFELTKQQCLPNLRCICTH